MDPGGASGTPSQYISPSGSSGSPSFYQETENVTGAAGAILTFQVTLYINANDMGQVMVNGGIYFLNDTFTVTLDGSGNGSFVARVQGDAGDTGTAVEARFTIISVSIGQIGSPSNIIISKTF